MAHPVEKRRVFYFLLHLSFYLSEAADVYMSSSCGQTINIGRSGGTLDSQSSLTYPNGQDCQLVLEAEIGRQILLTFKEFTVEGQGTGCQAYDYLEIYEGRLFQTTPDLGVFCGSLDDTHNVVSTSNYIRLRFKTDSSLAYRGFLLAYTSFDASGTCDWGELKCANGRCIDIDLKFNGFNNCGDNNDEGAVVSYEELSPGIILVIIIACLVCLVMCSVSCACIWQRVCKSTPRTQTQTPEQTGVNATQPTNNQQVPLAMQPTSQLDKSTPNPGQPGPYPSQPSPHLGQSGPYPAQPTQNPGQAVQYPGQPVQYPGQPVQYLGQPVQYPTQPGQYPNQPVQYPNQPVQYPNQPVQYPGQYSNQVPAHYTGQPPAYPGHPAPNMGQAAPNMGQTAPNIGQPAPNPQEPASNPQEPAPTTEQPTANTQEPTEPGESETNEI
ncbi:uncharacterized protein LOC119738533 [Patiria miniata]|uniref:CUB domain-containing protein n=1 Tax=Patiria miniata TaxID=46514 RepID=A0A914AYY7_PATMI|nr:uncharacterized protein LOC119738533 [Patiria miniata]